MKFWVVRSSRTPPGGISFTQFKDTQLMKLKRKKKTIIDRCFASFLIKICRNHAFLCVFQPLLWFDLWNRSQNSSALFSLYRSQANRSKLDFASSLVALHFFSYWVPLLPKLRFAEEQRVIERFQRAMWPALLVTQTNAPYNSDLASWRQQKSSWTSILIF